MVSKVVLRFTGSFRKCSKDISVEVHKIHNLEYHEQNSQIMNYYIRDNRFSFGYDYIHMGVYIKNVLCWCSVFYIAAEATFFVKVKSIWGK